MFKKFTRRFLLITLILLLTLNILFGYFLFKLTSPSTYNTLSDKQLYEDLTVLIFDEAYSDIKDNVEAQVASENGIDVEDEFTEDVIEIIKESILESNLAEIASEVTSNNIELTLSYINGSSDDIRFYIPKDDLVIFLEDYYPTITEKMLELAKEADICDLEGRCLTSEEKDELSVFIEEELDVEVKQTIEDIKNNEPIFSGGNEISLEEFNEVFDSEGEDNTLKDDLNFFRNLYTVGLVAFIMLTFFNILLFAIIMFLGPISKIRFSRNLGFVTFISGLIVLVPMGLMGLVIDDISNDWIQDAPTAFEQRLAKYVVDITKSLFELLGGIGILMVIIGAILLFIVPMMLNRRTAKVAAKAEDNKKPEVPAEVS